MRVGLHRSAGVTKRTRLLFQQLPISAVGSFVIHCKHPRWIPPPKKKKKKGGEKEGNKWMRINESERRRRRREKSFPAFASRDRPTARNQVLKFCSRSVLLTAEDPRAGGQNGPQPLGKLIKDCDAKKKTKQKKTRQTLSNFIDTPATP